MFNRWKSEAQPEGLGCGCCKFGGASGNCCLC
jgi:hypothetical protein